MEIKLYHNDRFRVRTGQESNFIDIGGMDWEAGITVDMYPHFHYIELRKKEWQVRLFLFKNKGVKKDIDLGWWSDAEVVYALNNVNK